MEELYTTIQAQELVAELESAAGKRVQLSQDARDFLIAELATRLAASAKPDDLYRTWRKNVPAYIARATHRRGSEGVVLEIEDMRLQLLSCGAICPGPERPKTRGHSGSGSAMSG
jgi:hypothetical protein